ncbi:T9SS type A sorting domain-containing protein, partial [bacterium]|nr:T9SS type A sorting domain-containing protein [bacterium]
GYHQIKGVAEDEYGFRGKKELLCEFHNTGGADNIVPDNPDFTLTELTGFNKPTSIAVGNFENRYSILITDRNAGDMTGNDSIKVFDMTGNLIKEIVNIHKPERICLSNNGELYLLTNNRDGIYKYDGEKFIKFIDVKNAKDIKWNWRKNCLSVLFNNAVYEYDDTGKPVENIDFTNLLNSFSYLNGDIIGNIEGNGEFINGKTNKKYTDYKKELIDFEINNSEIYGIDRYSNKVLKFNGKEKVILKNLNEPSDIAVFNYYNERIIGIVDRNNNRVVFIKDTDSSNAESEIASKVKTYPNPAKEKIVFTELPIGGTLNIYDLSGILVKSMKIDNNTKEWYLKNSAKKFVSSGVYFYSVLDTNNKSIKTGKVVIIK